MKAIQIGDWLQHANGKYYQVTRIDRLGDGNVHFACGFPEEEKFVEQVDNWLKSLKDRYTWKPSDEQMEALDDFIYAKYPNIEKHGASVKSLYQDLKKLKG